MQRLGVILVQAWRSCKGSKEGKRGYTCGLWQMMHSLAARIADEDKGGAMWLRTIRCPAPSVVFARH